MSILSPADQLALLGGAPVTSPMSAPAWPPANEATAARLGEIYMSRKWSFNGPCEQAFAADFAAYHGAKHGIFMSNGTVTLHTALSAHDIGEGDEVIVPALTWIATGMAPVYVGATPVFVDVEPDTLCMDPAAFEAAITPRTRAVIPVHIYGSMANLDAILAIAKKHNIVVIEDCAHGHGGKWAGRGLGSWGDVGSFSFQQSKTMAAGEGGICLTNSDTIAERLYRSKHIGYAAGKAQGEASSGPPEGLTCYNFRGNEFAAAILQDQLKNIGPLIDRYNANAALLEKTIADLPGVRVQARGKRSGPQNYYGLGIIFDGPEFEGIPLSRVQQAIRAEGLNCGGTYGTVYNHLLFNLQPQQYRIANGACPVAQGLGSTRTAILSHTWLGADEQTLEKIGRIISKVACNSDALRSAADADLKQTV